MKKVYRFLAITVVILAFSANVFGQATNTAGARIIAPITITSDVNMHFGTIARGTVASTILLTPAGARSVATGDAALSGLAPAHAAGSFTVSGEPTAGYSITLPLDGTVTLAGPGPSMGVNGFTSNPSGTGTIGAGGTQTLTVGATLSVGAATQTSGNYSGTFQVTVNYN
jgi:hypothetical protein